MTETRIAVVLKGYPRLSETFIAQELLALERRGLPLEIWSLRRPTDRARHPMHAAIQAPAAYLPEYLRDAPFRVLRGLGAALTRPRLPALLALFARDLWRDPSASRLRRFGQALVLAKELPSEVAHIHVHFLHTPASVARYAALLTGRRWSFSAHAKDIWTTPAWELTEKLRDAAWGVTCTRDGLARLEALAPGRTRLAYHGLDLARFPAPPPLRAPRDGTDPADPLRLLCVGRLVAKKGHDDLIDALAALPEDLHWRLDLIGGGELRGALEARVRERSLTERVTFLGALAQPAVVAAMRAADLFVLPTKPAPGGDRDGLPNVLMEAASQALPILATAFAGTPEFITDGEHGTLVPPGEPVALATALARLASDPTLRLRLGEAARVRLVRDFSEAAAIDLIADALRLSAGLAPSAKSLEPELAACAS
ncbi:glycosyltransferase [Methylobacterium pseudosasicola]|uniref:Glycosyltransferase involved in cell wall bisynthesis n=1 Tax=Methylobacterium pseudosasicola TaxID=582667 RepID=A0A1I4IW82_9HYPH|nr:glycosyltransferase [Methylobacterium pseudosasicola]SFL58642.1 Glycosyltransferase involved in cell wall bisynthesis [Methylobacterium pseudosasicola]